MDLNIEQEVKMVKNEIDEINSQEIQKKLVFLKQKYWEVSDKASRLLTYKLKKKQADSALYKITQTLRRFNINRRRFSSICCHSIKNCILNNRQWLTDRHSDRLLHSLHLPAVTETQNNILRAEVTLKEINLAITRLKAGSSPGADGFTSEWYKVLRDKLAPILMRVYWVLKLEMPPSCREAIISLVPKEGKNRQECDNLRPIRVLNLLWQGDLKNACQILSSLTKLVSLGRDKHRITLEGNYI